MIIEWNIQILSKRINDGCANAEASKTTWASEESNVGNIFPVGAVFDELVVDKFKQIACERTAGIPLINIVVEFKNGFWIRSV